MNSARRTQPRASVWFCWFSVWQIEKTNHSTGRTCQYIATHHEIKRVFWERALRLTSRRNKQNKRKSSLIFLRNTMSADTDSPTWSQSAKSQEQQEISKLVSNRCASGFIYCDCRGLRNANLKNTFDCLLNGKVTNLSIKNGSNPEQTSDESADVVRYSIRCEKLSSLKKI